MAVINSFFTKAGLLFFLISICLLSCNYNEKIIVGSSADSLINLSKTGNFFNDSLIELVKNSNSKKEYINNLSILAENSNGKATLILANEALEQSKQINYSFGINDSKSKLGLYYLRIKNFNLADSILTKTLFESRSLNQEQIYLQCLLWLGETNRLQFNLNKAARFFEEATTLSVKTNQKKREATAYLYLGIVYQSKNEFEKVNLNYNKALQIATDNNLINTQADVYRAMADLKRMEDNLPLSLEYFQKAISLSKKSQNLQLESFSLLGIADLQMQLKNYSEAKKNCTEAIEIAKKINNKTLLLNAKILECKLEIENRNLITLDAKLDSVISLAKENKNRGKVAFCLALKGDVARLKNQLIVAQIYYNEAYKIGVEIKDDNIVSNCLANISNIQYNESDLLEAKINAEKSLSFAIETNSRNDVKNASKTLFEIYRKLHLFEKALNTYIIYSDAKDSIENLDVIKKADKLQRDFQNEIRNEKEKLVKEENERKIETKNKIIFSILVAAFLLIVLVFVIFRSLKTIRKAKSIIEAQKQIVEIKNSEITNSINYAKGLQDVILPPMQLVKKYLNDSFIYFKPKDIVSGDFYWFQKSNKENDNFILFAAADCTGHGVPGAMVSMVCSNALNRVVSELGITEPGLILDKVRELVVDTFVNGEIKRPDGMDISLCKLNFSTLKLEWAGANNPLWIIRNNSNNIDEIKATKQGIGNIDFPVPYTTHLLELRKGDMLYLFTDGYADQFGGEHDKKFKASQMKKMFLNLKEEPMEEQKSIVHETLQNWMQNKEQVDDVCVFGVRL